MALAVMVGVYAKIPQERIAAEKALSQESVEADYRWIQVLPPGSGCFPGSCRAGQWPMAVMPVVAFDSTLWMMGQTSAWSSADGIHWREQPKIDWGERYGMAYLFFDDALWRMGGMRSWDDFRNDVWSSRDGSTWVEATPKAAWTPRRGHGALVFDDKMWVLGGVESAGRPDRLPEHRLNDVWSSTDGVHWVRETDHAPWSAREGFISLVFKHRMWVLGGAGKRDVWSSGDGRTWVQATPEAAWSERQNSGGVVWDGQIWIYGGRGYQDVWNSKDGVTWHLATESAPWTSRTTAQTVVFDDKVWIYGGKTGREDSWQGDVWVLLRMK